MHQPPPPLERRWSPEAAVRTPRAVGSRLEVRDARRHPLYAARLLGPAIGTAVAVGGGWHPLFQALALAWLGWSAWTTVRDRRAAAAHPVALIVGPEGMTFVETGVLAWDDIRDLRVRVVWGTDDGSPTRSWTLEVVPDRGPLHGRKVTLDSRFLTSSLEDVVATIEAYRPVAISETRG